MTLTSSAQVETVAMEAGSIVLAYKMKPGDILKYFLEMGSAQVVRPPQGEEQATRGVVEMLLVHSVLSESEKELHLESTIAHAQMREGQQAVTLASTGQAARMRMKRNGVVVTEGSGLGPPQITFPAKPVAIGESWTLEGRLDLAPGAEAAAKGDARPAVRYTCTLSGFEDLAGHQAAVIDLQCPETEFDVVEGIHQKTLVRGRTHFAWQEGILLHSEMVTSNIVRRRDGEVASETVVRLGKVV